MKRKQLDVHGRVVEVNAPTSEPGVVGKIETPVTDHPLEIQSREMRTQEPKPRPPARDRMLVGLLDLHVWAATKIRRLLLLPNPATLKTIQENQRMIANQHLGLANALADVRLRLRYYERRDLQLGKLRRQFDAEQMIRAKKKEAERPAPAEAAEHDGDSPA